MECDYTMFQVNTRPRKRHGYRIPMELCCRQSRSLHFDSELKRNTVGSDIFAI
jgi:hypothetical protein